MRRLTLLASGAAIVALVLSGCGGDKQQSGQNDGAGSFSGLIQNMATKSAEKSSAHMVFRAETAGQAIEGVGDIKLGAAPAMEMTMALPGQGELTTRLVDDVFYVKLPKEVEPGKPWVRIDPNGTDPAAKALAASIKQMKENGDPSQLLKQLESAGQITAQKQEDLNGKPTTRYTITIDLAKVAAQTGLTEMIEQARQAGLSTLPLDVWVDQENLPVRMLMEMTVKDPKQPEAGGANVKITVDYSDWGKPVNVTAPPPAEVGELPKR